MNRPRPPASMLSPDDGADPVSFVPAPDLVDWLVATFIADGAPLLNEDHAHLRYAKLACLWTTVPNARGGRSIVGQCELGKPGGTMGKWARARAEQQISEWFDGIPDFLFTFDAGYADACSDARFLALAEHELYHAGQELDEYGIPRFSKATGQPVFALKSHDIEEFVGVVRRYGADAAGVQAMMAAAAEGPTVAQADIDFACGTCRR